MLRLYYSWDWVFCKMQGRGQSFVCIFIPICPSTICQSSVVRPFHRINGFFWNLKYLEHLTSVFLVECVPQTSSVSITRLLMQIIVPTCWKPRRAGQPQSVFKNLMWLWCLLKYRNVNVMANVRPPKIYKSSLKNCRYLFVLLHFRGLPLSWLVSWICWVMLEVMERNRIWAVVTMKAKPFEGIFLVHSRKTVLSLWVSISFFGTGIYNTLASSFDALDFFLILGIE